MSSGADVRLRPASRMALVIGILLLAFCLRVVGQWHAPLGWRDDELSSALVVSRHVLEGDWRVYYPDASGHEGLYQYLQAATLLAFGAGPFGIRGPSILLGTLGVLLTYLLAHRLYGPRVGLLSAALLAVSFWSLMYSRTGQRHISVTVTTLLAFWLLWRGLPVSGHTAQTPGWGVITGAGWALGLGFYTYFASRGVPLIPLAWLAYLAIWQRGWLRQAGPRVAMMVALALALAVPLVVTLRRQPGAETRVAEVARPIHDARAGDWSTLIEYTGVTLAMFSHNGDEEWLYNIPHRPVFGLAGACLFWVGVGLALFRSLGPARDARAAFLLLWLGAGLVPGILSVPAASLGHCILAMPVSMIFPALALEEAASRLGRRSGRAAGQAFFMLVSLLLVGWEGTRAVVDYWQRWPHDPFNRVLHHSDLHEAARWLKATDAGREVAIGGFLLERWDQQAMRLDLGEGGWRVRAFDPRVAAVFTTDGDLTVVVPAYLRAEWEQQQAGEPIPGALPGIYKVAPQSPPADADAQRFENGLTLTGWDVTIIPDETALNVVTWWRAERLLALPPFPLLSKPPAPGEDDRPRLAIFAQLIDSAGQRVAGFDGLGVDPYTLYPGDSFRQVSRVSLAGLPAGRFDLVIGLYNPASSERLINTTNGQDSTLLRAVSIP